MKKRALKKDFRVEVKKSMNRFLSILFIVALGVAFFSGIQASAPDMRATGDWYFDDSDLMDVRVISTLGVTDDDLEALRQVDGVEAVSGSYMEDIYCGEGDSRNVLHMESLPEHMNRPVPTEGRLPEEKGECFLDISYANKEGYQVGDTLHVTVSSEDDTHLTQRKFTIAGIGYSPNYVSFSRGSTMLGTGSLAGFVYVLPDVFDMEVYSIAYIQATGAKEEMAFTSGYEEKIDHVIDGIEAIEDARCEIRYQEVMDEAYEKVEEAKEEVADGQKKLDDAGKKLEDGKEEADRKLAEAKEELLDGEQELLDGRRELKDAQKKLADGKRELVDGEKEITDNEETIADGKQQLEEAKEQLNRGQADYESGLNQYNQQYASSVQQLKDAQTELEIGRQQLDAGWDEYYRNLSELESGEAQLEAGEAKLEDQQAAYDAGMAEFSAGKAQYEAAAARLPQLQAAVELAENEEDAAALKAQIDAINANGAVIAQKEAELNMAGTQLGAAWAELTQKKAELNNGKAQLASARAVLEQNEQKLKNGQDEINRGYKQLSDAKDQLEAAKAQLDSGWAQLQDSEDELQDGEQQLSDARQELTDARKELADGQQELDDAIVELAESQQKLKHGWREYYDGKAEADEQISDGERKIEEAQQELFDAEVKIADAEADIADIKKPEWYVNDRGVLPENSSFGENADRMANIAKVVPILFFLVAALISLTTMTRMVEEERTQIGTLKALGYSKLDIASKYMKYALFATAGGSVIGVLIGEKIFPYVIITAYGMMFQYLPKLILPYNWVYAAIATGMALICTLGATLSACYRELQAVPAELMRPPTPKEGKRILLERIPFLWKHMSFTWKSTARNLMRYKKRFLMTVIGIGGCMGLLLIGFGLQDSIMDIGIIQYEELQLYDAMVIVDTNASEAEQQTPLELLQADSRITGSKRFYAQQEDIRSEGISRKEWSLYVYVPESTENLDQFLLFRDRVTKQTFELPEEGAIITEKISQELGIRPGDTIALKRDDGNDIVIPITAICENYLHHYLYMTPAFFEKTFGEAPEYNSIFWTCDEEQDVIEEIGETLLSDDAVLNITYTGTLVGQINKMLGAMDVVMIVIIVSAGMLAFVVLYNLNNININERRRELATLKVLGFYDGEVAAYVYRENVLLTLIGAALGILIGKFLHMYVITTVEVDSCMFGRNINLDSFVIGTLFTIGFSIIVNCVMYFKLKKIDMVESLKSIE